MKKRIFLGIIIFLAISGCVIAGIYFNLNTTNWISGLPVAVAILSAVVAYIFNGRLERKKTELKFVSDQLQYLYGPLFSLSHASEQAWNAFRRRYRPGISYFDDRNPPSHDDIVAWRKWMVKVFMPLNLEIEKVITNNTHLIVGYDIPDSFLKLLEHVGSYKAVIYDWDITNVDRSRLANVSSINFPNQYRSEVEHTFLMLKRRQTSLVGAFGKL